MQNKMSLPKKRLKSQLRSVAEPMEKVFLFVHKRPVFELFFFKDMFFGETQKIQIKTLEFSHFLPLLGQKSL